MAGIALANALSSGLSAYKIGTGIKDDYLYRKAREAGLSAEGPMDYEAAAEIAARHGRWGDAQGYHGMASADRAQLERDRSRFATQALSLEQAGDFDGLSRLVSQMPPALFGLEKHRKPAGLRRVVRTFGTETGENRQEELWALDINNSKTGTRGPQTLRASADGDDNVVYMRARDLRAYLSPWAQPKGREREIKSGGGGLLFDPRTGEVVREPDPKAGQAPKDPVDYWKFDKDGNLQNTMTNEHRTTPAGVKTARRFAEKTVKDFMAESGLMNQIDPRNERRFGSLALTMMDGIAFRYGVGHEESVGEVMHAIVSNSEYSDILAKGDQAEVQQVRETLVDQIGAKLAARHDALRNRASAGVGLGDAQYASGSQAAPAP